jgi:hypothetical protein
MRECLLAAYHCRRGLGLSLKVEVSGKTSAIGNVI